mmetsp:Transcript_115032/g.273510  ORF Transcript_115032/g.273510 Transcript_115032/m.273510 type:complete len:232 (-) Transcript_115032:334-1029(-)
MQQEILAINKLLALARSYLQLTGRIRKVRNGKARDGTGVTELFPPPLLGPTSFLRQGGSAGSGFRVASAASAAATCTRVAASEAAAAVLGAVEASWKALRLAIVVIYAPELGSLDRHGDLHTCSAPRVSPGTPQRRFDDVTNLDEGVLDRMCKILTGARDVEPQQLHSILKHLDPEGELAHFEEWSLRVLCQGCAQTEVADLLQTFLGRLQEAQGNVLGRHQLACRRRQAD